MVIHELAQQSSVSAKSIRFYESIGLLPRPKRASNSYRQYEPADLERLRFIASARTLGFSLEYISEILAARDNSIAPCQRVLDLPYCHHEKWDGTGYPRGLKGEEIPLVARLFAVVDVWDALCSDRPYRPAWAKEKALEHIKSLSGTYFDPKVVETFLDMIKE